MDNLRSFQGIGQFGPAYQFMLEHDTHTPDSVDRSLFDRMIRLCPETADALYDSYTPTSIDYPSGSKPELERIVREQTEGLTDSFSKLERLIRYTAGLETDAENGGLDRMRFGGTEEAIIRRGSDWCTDVARVACALCQIAGLSARMVYLFDTEQAYSGHALIEVYGKNTWGLADSSTALVYRDRDGRPLSAWDLMRKPDSISELRRLHPDAYYSEAGLFRGVGIVNYYFWKWPEEVYAASGINAYYRSILEQAGKGWPGGLRWLCGEDQRLTE